MTSRGQRLRVGFLANADPNNPRSWSGTYAYMVQALQECDLELDILPWEPDPPSLARRLVRWARTSGKAGHDWAVSGDHGRAIRRYLRDHPVDVIFAVAASTQGARLGRPDVAFVNASDTTFRSVVDLYPAFRDLSASAVRQGRRLDEATVRRADRLVYPSTWAAQAATEHCDADPNAVRVVQYGANIARPDHVQATLNSTPTVLFVGVDWERKGGDVVVEMVDELRQRGRDLRLVTVGAKPPARYASSVNEALHFDKSTPTGLAGLARTYRDSDVLVLPSQADCSPVVLCEAAAFGLPSIVSDVGGMPEIVEDGVTGRVVARSAPSGEWADALAGVLDAATHRSMSQRARARSDEVLNWQCWAAAVEQTLHEAVSVHAANGGS